MAFGQFKNKAAVLEKFSIRIFVLIALAAPLIGIAVSPSAQERDAARVFF